MTWQNHILILRCVKQRRNNLKKKFKEQQVSSTQQRILSSCFILRPVSSDPIDFIREFNKIMKGN